MARRIATTHGGKEHGDAPPPSTLAAQIVQNQTEGPVNQQNGETPTFAELLNEILHNHAATPETDIETNIKLVNVVAEAGLGPLAIDNPFAECDVLLPLAFDSIAVIEATIKRQPEILFAATKQHEPRLLLSLLARVLAICGRRQCEQLPIDRLLDSLLLALDTSLQVWGRAKVVRRIIQDCLDDVMFSLEATTGSKTDLSIKLPPARSIVSVWPELENAITLPHGCQTSIADQSQALMLAIQLCNVRRLPAAWRTNTQCAIQKITPALGAALKHTKQWDAAATGILLFSSNITFLVQLFNNLSIITGSHSIQIHTAQGLIQNLRRDPNAVSDHLLPALCSLASSEAFDKLHEDLRIAIVTVITRLSTPENVPERAHDLVEALRQDNVMTDSRLQAAFRDLSVRDRVGELHRSQRKRRKVVQMENESAQTTIRRITQLLYGMNGDNLNGITEAAPSAYRSLSEEEQCEVWQLLRNSARTDSQATIKVVSALVQSREIAMNKRARILSIITLQTCLQTTTDSAYISLTSSPFGQLCLRGLQSSLRELRVASVQCLGSFLRDELAAELKEANRKCALEFLRALSDRDVANEQETLVSAWSQVALFCEDSELNLSLLRLVEYLGHSNPLISGLAFTELERIAEAKAISPSELFKPFWSSIAVSVVQDLHSRPQKIQQLCDLLELDVNRFLVNTQQETVPALVLTQKSNVLQRIAAARGHGTTVQDLLLQPRTNLMATLALLLIQPTQSPEDSAMACLVSVAPGLQGTDLSNLVKIDPALLACHLLKHAGDQSESRKSRAYQAFQLFASLAERRAGAAKSKPSRMLTEFFDVHILGIMTHFSEIIENNTGLYSKLERLRCIRAIAEMVTIAKTQVSGALPQIRAALQSSMDHPDLCQASFSAWLYLLPILETDDVASIVDQTFALILRHWPNLSEDVRQTCHQQISNLVKNHNQMLQEHIMTLPSLAGVPLLSKLSAEIERVKASESIEAHCRAFTKRLLDESRVVVLRALEELPPFLNKNQDFVYDCATSEQPTPVLPELFRALMDANVKYSAEDGNAAELCGKAFGIIGCLDPNRVEATRKKRRVLVLSNFDRAAEIEDWSLVFLEDILVKAFKSVSNARAQGFLAFVMQELLRFCEFNEGTVLRQRTAQTLSKQQKWQKLPESVRITLTPLINSRYVVTSSGAIAAPNRVYPGFSQESSHSSWLRSLVYDLMWKAKGENAQMVFPVLARTIRGHDLAIASFMLPYTMLNVVLGGTVAEVKGIADELLAVLQCEPIGDVQRDTIKLCSESVFNVLDYMSLWLQEKKKVLGEARAAAYKTGRSPDDFDEARDVAQIETVETFLSGIPADVIANRALLCGSYARALFNWEQHIRRQRPIIPSQRPPQQASGDELLYDKLQDIYAQIDEPDGLEGISAHLTLLSEDQQAIQHAKARRWAAAQAWYETQLAQDPYNVDIEERLLSCFRETGRYEPLLKYAESFLTVDRQATETPNAAARLLPDILGAQMMNGDLEGLYTTLESTAFPMQSDFNAGIAGLVRAVADHDVPAVTTHIKRLRTSITQSMTAASSSSVQGSHEDLKKLHVLGEVEMLCSDDLNTMEVKTMLERRLAVIGSYVLDKQYVLGVRRVIMESIDAFTDQDVGSLWLTTAKFARQLGNTEHAYNAVLKAYKHGDRGATIEEARLLWRDGHQRHAIHALETAIASGLFDTANQGDANIPMHQSTMTTRSTTSTRSSEAGTQHNVISAKVHLLLAKWLDATGQSQFNDMTEKFQKAAKLFARWEKGHYYLGKHYQKLLDTEKGLPKEKQSSQYQSGELDRLVVENLIRSIPFGNKYWHETIPKILTLWLDLGACTVTKARHEEQAVFDRRVKALQNCNKQLQKYFERVPPYVFYSAVPQMISRITHPNKEVWKLLLNILTRIASAHPNQTLWSLLALVKSTDRTRLERGTELLDRLKDPKIKARADGSNIDLRVMITHGQRLSDGLLRVCEVPIDKHGPDVKLSEHLDFNHKLVPSQLVVPIETTLTISLPSGASHDTIKRHKAFVQEKITIQSFAEEVLVLNSLQRPRKLTVRGSDGKQYGLLCKPKDDLRKDRRLMEFNSIINRTLKRDAESSKRRLYVKTYAVTPLSEESGIIEWVEGIKPMRDILLNIYARKGIRPNYTEIKNILDQASSSPENAHLFGDKVLSKFPSVLHEWLVEVYPEPEAWFAARLRYARTAAVMSIVGHVLGLGDRHGENILLEESTGGVFHVDFNCLFDKGLTFDKPELVPFRLTHNMVDAMGAYGYEGPFRKSSELTVRLLRQNKGTLMTVLETFLYDPTTDFIGKKKRSTAGVPETPQEILESVENKLKGLLKGEKVPLGVEGYVDALIKEATSPWCLASMYIGWCAFF
ncbi:hypothetical protein BDY17DRAFT_290011 [Neohortaea acidophila]|uniref:Serine/threonine-protein kinase MEC1 n=1 Tax=Neohortaea acidophila TaxID=245834 RepID=A0A6A6Q7A9_9PEZI|nr:uncharacterized protein BDY17DRAFT_290011 [Neohortaea acidophila]KAF2487961.1 hypothetical protein BDY17DRAFT_290011 [Neohortaea acidophila]